MNFLTSFFSKFKKSATPENVFKVFEEPIRSEIFSAAHLERHGESLAEAQPVFKHRTRGQDLRGRVEENGQVLLASYNQIALEVRNQRAITPSAEWLIDNFHIVEDQIRDIRDHLPGEYYRELPKLSDGPLLGYPRVYGIAWAFVAHTDSLFDAELLKRFVKSYQKVQPLTIGELWAISITLRVVMIENLRRLSARIVGSQLARQEADKIADQLLGLSGQQKLDVNSILKNLESTTPQPGFAVQLVQRLRFQDPKVTPVLLWLDARLASAGLVADEIVTIEHAGQTAANVTVRNIITSMRIMSAFEWQDFFEEVSLVDDCLREHPLYAKMDFITRDRYRHGLEDLAKGSKKSEVEIAKACVVKALKSKTFETGYFLISAGREEFEKEVGFKKSIRRIILRWYISHAALNYIASVFFLTALALLFPILELKNQLFYSSIIWPIVILILGTFPASEIALTLLNRLTVAVLGPRHLPRLEIKTISQDHRTFVVVPTLLLQEKNIEDQIDQLEVHHLSNPEGEVYFALLSDWADSDTESKDLDLKLLEIAQKKILNLNQKYGLTPGGKSRFYIFHRRRLWNPSEGKWIGWERKRGKLHEFNRLLRGAKDTSYLSFEPSGVISYPEKTRFVITLDADTRLPKGAVSQLVGTFAHPLNHAKFDSKLNKVIDGYGLLQPRITPSLPAMRDSTVFQRVFSGPSGVDPYASAISDVYQDLFGEGSYTGKGIYDLDVFEKSLHGRIPENSLLSHDLFEGCFARCGLLSDTEFFEDFPSHSEVSASRVHRWTRGDWQLLPWILGREGRSISLIGRWKMIDNLRRSLVPPATFFIIVASFCFNNTLSAYMMALTLLSLVLPVLLPFLIDVAPFKRKVSYARNMRSSLKDLGLGLGKVSVSLILLSHHSWQMLDAITRALFRLLISRKKMLEWTTAAQSKSTASLKFSLFFRRMAGGVFLALISTAIILYFTPFSFFAAAPFLFFWLASPVFARFISQPPKKETIKPLSSGDVDLLRGTGRKIWRFFSTFVTADDHYLPPDNIQEDPNLVVAHRSSPTNFGLYLLSVLSARDFGWIGNTEAVDRLHTTLNSMQELPRFQGHFFNWYETQSFKALEPKYISSVDNGNLAGHLLAVAQGCNEILKSSAFSDRFIQGIKDSLSLLRRAIAAHPDNERLVTTDKVHLYTQCDDIEEMLSIPTNLISNLQSHLDVLNLKTETLLDMAKALSKEVVHENTSEILVWAEAVARDLKFHLNEFNLLFSWMPFLQKTEFEGESLESVTLWNTFIAQVNLYVPVNELPQHCEDLARQLIEIKRGKKFKKESIFFKLSDSLLESLESSAANARILNTKIEEVIELCYRLFNDMDFKLLYDFSRKLFSIGFRVAENQLDASYYDLLASEARLTSFIAIAKGDVPANHWFRLGRSLTPIEKGAALISWSGSMFEYLMPSLVMYTPAGSLLEQTCRLIVKKQIQYGAERNVPWGISESAYNTRDLQLTYQYSNFGVPELGLKRGLGDDLVIAPYATILASMYDPTSACINLNKLSLVGAEGKYGFYEAVDFTTVRLPEGETASVVKAYMAHHQGMALVSIANVLFNGVMRHRFHAEPIIQSTELLLQERTPRNVTTARPHRELIHVGQTSESLSPVSRKYHSPSHPVPTTHMLSNGQYAVMITSAGSGYSRFKDIAITRWREDVTLDNWGSYLFLRDLSNNEIWSATYQPTVKEPDYYEAVFTEDRAKISRDEGPISSSLEIFLSPEDNAEIRRLSLTNNGSEVKEIEVTSYFEVVLTTQSADVAHPAFSNLFVQTEFIPEISALVATRRARSKKDQPLWMAHIVAVDGRMSTGVEYETDRSKFLGRGRNIKNPVSVFDGKPLSNTVGAVLDPIMSLRTRVRIDPGTTVKLTFSTIVSHSRESVINLADKFRDASTFERASTLAWTQAQVQLHYLGIEHDEANLFQQLANRLLYSDSSLRPGSDILKKNKRDITALWAHGISGDNPIVLVRIDDPENRAIVRQLLRAHEYWGTKRLVVDLIILNEKATSYAQDFQNSLEAIVRASALTSGSYLPESKGKVFILRADLLSAEDRDLFATVPRATLVARQGSLAEQVKRMRRSQDQTSKYRRRISDGATVSHQMLAMPELKFFNGLGGFTNDGREYVTYLVRGQRTPAPWINVIANPTFGFQVSERGSGFTWAENSRENQITPWTNDPVSDPSGEAFYINDKDTGFLWSPTAAPIFVENASYIARHGQGYSKFEHLSYGIYSELTQFVAWDDPIKISNLVLENRSKISRNLSVTSYIEWVLGFSRTSTAPYLVTEFDEASQAVFAQNPWNNEYGKQVSFTCFASGKSTYTCSRVEFLGRNGSLDKPLALVQDELLTSQAGAGLDPCAAIQTEEITLAPGERVNLSFLLGQGKDANHARALIEKYRKQTYKNPLQKVLSEWDLILNKVQVNTPDEAMNLMLNRWLLYQTMVCRFWARSAFYQAGGAYGFRDQLQDVMALSVSKPDLARAHILKACARQFVEGDVQHWWHPPLGRGVRTQFSDDLLWLPFVVSHYLNVTQDPSILDQQISFIEGEVLKPEQEDAYFTPKISDHSATLYEHCALTIDRSLKVGSHGLPLMGAGDWNDGMNRVGHEGKGESVWLAWFLISNLDQFAKVAAARGDIDHVNRWKEWAEKLKRSVESEAWDGAWYRRAYFDDGTPLGSAANSECRIDSIAQSWGVLSGAADLERAHRALASVEEFLIRPGDNLLLLFTPPFDRTTHDPGYIKGYLPGVRENGGQYSHAAVWTLMAYAELNNGQRAVELFSMLNPINHSLSRAGVHRYKVEPYVIAADIYSEPPYVGRGGWTWYTGSSGWMYRAGVESILGLHVTGDYLNLVPHIHPNWETYSLTYKFGESIYEITVNNPSKIASGNLSVEMNGIKEAKLNAPILLVDDGNVHKIVATLISIS